ncbi:MAG: DUF5320 domain-containing protein [Desulfobacterales bacterium]|nr:DUF5320 domain-containing protein [Desulfobacterales bacterium]
MPKLNDNSQMGYDPQIGNGSGVYNNQNMYGRGAGKGNQHRHGFGRGMGFGRGNRCGCQLSNQDEQSFLEKQIAILQNQLNTVKQRAKEFGAEEVQVQ